MNKYICTSITLFLILLTVTPRVISDVITFKTIRAMSTSASPATMDAYDLDISLNRIEKEQIYLRQLDMMQKAVETELHIVRLLRECSELQAVCSGKGLSLKMLTHPYTQNRVASEEQTVSEISPPLPHFLSVYRNQVVTEYQNQLLEVAVGESIGPFKIQAITPDYIELFGPFGEVRVSMQWSYLNEHSQ